MRRIIIGDVHGCLDELLILWNHLSISPKDQTIFVGDLLHKGPESAAVVDFVYQHHLLNPSQCFTIKGNHEERQLRYECWEDVSKLTGRKNPMQYTDGYGDLKLSDQHLAFLDDAPYFYEFTATEKIYPTRQDNFLVVHAGISRKMRWLQKPLFIKDKYIYQWYINCLMRLRWETPSGSRVVKLDKVTDQDTFWAERYNGRFGHVFFGHQPFLEDKPKKFEYATGLDLGCVFGNKLAAAIIEPNGRVTYETVPALKEYTKPWIPGKQMEN